MKFVNYTPGPWKPCRANENFDGTYYDLGPDDDVGPYTSIEAENRRVANCHDLFKFNDEDAELMAAAPEFLALLIEARKYVELAVNNSSGSLTQFPSSLEDEDLLNRIDSLLGNNQ